MFEPEDKKNAGEPPEKSTCRNELIVAYLDGELQTAEQSLFENHLPACAACAAQLREHQELLRLLDAKHDDSLDLPLPKNFARIVTAHAQSDVTGVRDKGLAIWLCASLAALCGALLGIAGGVRVLGLARAFIKGMASVALLLGRGLYDVWTGLSVVLHAVGRNLVGGVRPLGLLLILLLLVASLGLLLRLLANYRQRLQATD